MMQAYHDHAYKIVHAERHCQYALVLDRLSKAKTGWLFVIFLTIVLQKFVLQQFLAITETGLRVIFIQGDLRDLFEVCALIFGIFAVQAATSYFIPSLSTQLAGEAIFQMRSDLITRVLYFDQKFF